MGGHGTCCKPCSSAVSSWLQRCAMLDSPACTPTLSALPAHGRRHAEDKPISPMLTITYAVPPIDAILECQVHRGRPQDSTCSCALLCHRKQFLTLLSQQEFLPAEHPPSCLLYLLAACVQTQAMTGVSQLALFLRKFKFMPVSLCYFCASQPIKQGDMPMLATHACRYKSLFPAVRNCICSI